MNAIKDLLLGSIAGIVNVLLTAPFWVVNARMRTTHRPNAKRIPDKDTENQKEAELTLATTYPYRNLISGLLHIGKTEGVKTLWSGTIPSLILVSNPALQFMMYELLKRHTISYLSKQQQTGHSDYSDFGGDNDKSFDQAEISSLGYFVIGAIAKTFATIITYPLQLIQTQLRIKSRTKEQGRQGFEVTTNNNTTEIKKNKQDTSSTNTNTNTNAAHSSTGDSGNKETKSVPETMGMLQVFWEILHFQGFKGLFRGMGAKILQTVLTTAFMFMAYENINRIVRQSLLRR